MIKTVELNIKPQDINDLDLIKHKACKKLRMIPNSATELRIQRKSIDARGKEVIYKLRCAVASDGVFPVDRTYLSGLSIVKDHPEVIIVGAGPAGYFAALEAIKHGLKPIVLDRGKDVQSRRRDLKAIQQEGVVNPHSNYCFGEGGAGTYSDGKLYTRSHKRGNIQEILQILVEHGATSNILYDAHPHIGSNKLPKIVSRIRKSIEEYGGQVLFDKHVTDIIIHKQEVQGVVCADGSTFKSANIILATGHSARDVYTLLHKKNVEMIPKDFALGVRVEHKQDLIDEMQYKQSPREENLPASSYAINCQVDNTGVFSFCMCPGGLIVPASTAPSELVVNGMSLSKRDSPFANSGFVTAISIEELARQGYTGLFAALDFQKKYEQIFFENGNGSQSAPAQRMTDFVQKRNSKNLSDTSYIPGIYSAPLHELLPDFVTKRLTSALLHFKRKIRSYYTEEAQLIGLESRTSSPITIPRDRQNLMHPDIKGLYPCGEGAGYAGGILSACMDGQRVIRALAQKMNLLT